MYMTRCDAVKSAVLDFDRVVSQTQYVCQLQERQIRSVSNIQNKSKKETKGFHNKD